MIVNNFVSKKKTMDSIVGLNFLNLKKKSDENSSCEFHLPAGKQVRP